MAEMSVLIKSIEGTELTAYVIRLLNQNNIFNINEFFNENPKKLCKITNLSMEELTRLKSLIARHFCPSVTNLLQLKKKMSDIPISTKIESLDTLLNGGFLQGNLIDICGFPNAGKSILCLTIALNLIQRLNFDVLILDTKCDFSGTRTKNMLTSRGCNNKEIEMIMNKIFVVRIFSATDMLKHLKELFYNIICQPRLKLVIIDSLPSLWYLFHGLNSVRGISLLVEMTNILKKLCIERGIIVLAVNLATRKNEFDMEDFSAKSQTYKPSLGKYWETAPNLRLLIEEIPKCFSNATPPKPVTSNDTCNENHRIITIWNSNYHEINQHCIIELTDKGVI